jgi:hypothetical protein
MVSDWMVDGNITDFVKMRPDVNRFALVGSHSGPFCLRFKLVDDRITALAGRRCLGPDIHPWSGNDPWGSQRGAALTAGATLIPH